MQQKFLFSANLMIAASLTRMSNMRKYLKALSLVSVLALISSPIYAQQKTMVTRIIDGDAIQVLYGGVEKRVRFIGVDAPEMQEPTIKAAIKARDWLRKEIAKCQL